MSLNPNITPSPPTASESLLQTLAIGNITGANDIVISNPQGIDFAGNINIQNNTGGGGSDVIIQSIPANSGSPLTTAVFYDPATYKLKTQVQQNENLAQTLAFGNSTGANDISVASPQKISFDGNISLKNNNATAGTDVIIDSVPAGTAPQVLGYDPTTKKVYYQTGVSQVSTTDPNIIITGTTSNPILDLNTTLTGITNLTISNNIEAMNGIFDNSINVQGEAIIQGGIDMSSDGSNCILFTEDNRLTVNSNEVAYLTDIPASPPNVVINSGTNISVSNPSVNTFTITNTQPNTTITAGTAISVSNPSTNSFTISNTGVSQLSSGSNISVSAGTGNVAVALSNAVNIASGNSVNFNSGSVLSVNTPITTNQPANNAGNSITMAIPLVSDGSVGASAGLTIQTAPGSATNGNVSLSLNAPDNVFATTFFAPATTGTTGGTTAGQLNLWSYPSATSPFYHSFNTNQAYCNLQVAPDGSQMIVGNVIGGNSFTQAPNTRCELKVAGTNSSGNGIIYGRVFDDTFYTPPTATPPTINSGTGITVANPSANTYTITNTAPYVAPTATTQSGGNYTIQLSDLGDTVLFDAPQNNQTYTITLPTNLSGATAGQTVFLGRSPLDTSLGSSYNIVSGLYTLATLGTSNPTSSVLQFIISSSSGGSIVWEMVGQRLLAGSNISLTGTTDYTTVNCTLPQTTITGGININVQNPSTNTFTVDCLLPQTTITASNNTTISNPSTNNFSIGSSVPYWGAGTSSSSTFLYTNAFGSANVSIPLTSLLDKSGLYMFNVNVISISGGTYPNVGGGAINIYLTGSPVSTQPGASTFVSSYDMNAVSGFASVAKQFFAVLPAGGAVSLQARPYDGGYNSNFSIWNVGLNIQCIYLGAFSN